MLLDMAHESLLPRAGVGTDLCGRRSDPGGWIASHVGATDMAKKKAKKKAKKPAKKKAAKKKK